MALPPHAILVRFEPRTFGLDTLLPLLRALESADPEETARRTLWVSRESGLVVLTVVTPSAGDLDEALAEAIRSVAPPGTVRAPPTLDPERYLVGFDEVIADLQEPWSAVRDVLTHVARVAPDALLDRRGATRRRPAGLAAEVRTEDSVTPGLVRDISLDGCYLQASPPLPREGTACEVVLLGAAPVTLPATVVHAVTSPRPRRPQGLALRFRPTRAQGQALQALLDDTPLAEASARREPPRVHTAVEVTLRSTEDVHRALIDDLSGGGLFVPMASPPPVGTGVDVALRLPGERTPIELPAVVRHREDQGLRPGAGLAFHTSPEALAPLQDWLRLARLRQGRLVLVADDDAFFRRVTLDLLQGAGYRVLEAEDGEAALRTVSEHILSLSLVLLDVEMPGLSGSDLLDRIRRAGGEADLPLVVVSGTVPDAQGRETLRAMGADAFLDKQDLEDQLLATVDQHALRTPPALGEA